MLGNKTDSGIAKAKGEIDTRFSHMPPYPGLRQFRCSISATSRWQGNEYKNMAKVYSGIVKAIIPADALRALIAYLDVYRMAHYISHTESTLKLLDEALNKFWGCLRDEDGCYITYDILPQGWHCPKLHYLRHYTDWIRQHGTLPYSSTDRTELWHKPLEKAYRASNKGPQATEFILHDEARSLAWSIWESSLPSKCIFLSE